MKGAGLCVPLAAVTACDCLLPPCLQVLTITLEKVEAARSARLHFWPCAIKGHPEIDTHALPALDGAQMAAVGALGLMDGPEDSTEGSYARAFAAASL